MKCKIKYNTTNKHDKIFTILIAIAFFSSISILIHPMSFYHSIGSYGKLFSNWEMKNSLIVQNITEKCAYFENEEQIECVLNNMNIYSYNFTRAYSDPFPLIKKSDDFSSGYVCRDIAITYDAIFTYYGYKTDFIFTNNHIYNHIWKDDSLCEINMDEYYCWW